MPLAPGSVLADTIRLERPLGRGAGSGAWIGRHLRLRIDVVVKLVAGEQAELAARIGGPHVVRLLDLGATPEGLPYVVQELLEGESLDARLARAGPMSLAEVAALVEQAARGLGRGHKLGVVHRRLRPAKIFLDGSGIEDSVGGQAPPWLAKILDFGLAKSTGTSGGPGTLDLPLDLLRYRSPEQLLGTGEVDPRSDLWALGVIAYEALAGRPPFEADTLAGLIGTVTTAKVTPPGVPGGGAEPEAEAFWRRALAPRPADRFGSAQEMAAALCRIGQAGVPRVYSDEAYAGTLRVAPAPAGPGPAPTAPASEPPATVPIDGSEPKEAAPAEPRGRWRRGDTLRLEDERDAEPADDAAPPESAGRIDLPLRRWPRLGLLAGAGAALLVVVLLALALRQGGAERSVVARPSSSALAAVPVPAPPIQAGEAASGDATGSPSTPAPDARAPAAAPARLRLNSVPPSRVVLDGRPIGQTPLVGIEVEPGSHAVVFFHPTRGKRARTVTVRPGETQTVAVNFRAEDDRTRSLSEKKLSARNCSVPASEQSERFR